MTGSDEIETDESTLILEKTARNSSAITAVSRATTSIFAATTIVAAWIRNN